MNKAKVKNTWGKTHSAVNPHEDELRVFPSCQVSEPTRSPFVVWSTKNRVIVSEHESKSGALNELRILRKDIKAGKYDY